MPEHAVLSVILDRFCRKKCRMSLAKLNLSKQRQKISACSLVFQQCHVLLLHAGEIKSRFRIFLWRKKLRVYNLLIFFIQLIHKN